jgi:DNA-binding MarR family transcriptional regulator
MVAPGGTSVATSVGTSTGTTGTKVDTELTRDLLAHLHGLVEGMKQYAQDLALEFGLSLSQLDALKSLGGEPCSQRDLARSLHFDASNVTDIVDRLEARGLVSRTVDPNDRRVRRLVLTPEGEAVRRKLVERIIDDAPITRLSAVDQATLRDLLAKITDPIELPE